MSRERIRVRSECDPRWVVALVELKAVPLSEPPPQGPSTVLLCAAFSVRLTTLRANVCGHPYVENMVAFQGDTLFAGCSNASYPPPPGYGVEVIDVTNITEPTLLGTMFGSSGNNFAMVVPNGEYLYLGGYPEQNGNPSSTAGALYTVETGTGTNQDDVTFLPANVSFANQAVRDKKCGATRDPEQLRDGSADELRNHYRRHQPG